MMQTVLIKCRIGIGSIFGGSLSQTRRSFASKWYRGIPKVKDLSAAASGTSFDLLTYQKMIIFEDQHMIALNKPQGVSSVNDMVPKRVMVNVMVWQMSHRNEDILYKGYK